MNTLQGIINQSEDCVGYLEDMYEVVQARLPFYRKPSHDGRGYYYPALSHSGNAFCSVLLDRLSDRYRDEIQVAGMFVATEDTAACREKLIEAIKLNIVNQKKHSYEDLCQRLYPFPYTQKIFVQNRHKFALALIILSGFEEVI